MAEFPCSQLREGQCKWSGVYAHEKITKNVLISKRTTSLKGQSHYTELMTVVVTKNIFEMLWKVVQCLVSKIVQKEAMKWKHR